MARTSHLPIFSLAIELLSNYYASWNETTQHFHPERLQRKYLKVLIHILISLFHIYDLDRKWPLKMLVESKVWLLKQAACRGGTLSWWLDHENSDYISRFIVHTHCFQVVELWAWFQEVGTCNLILKAVSCFPSVSDSWPPWNKQFCSSWSCTKMFCLTTSQKTKHQPTMK